MYIHIYRSLYILCRQIYRHSDMVIFIHMLGFQLSYLKKNFGLFSEIMCLLYFIFLFCGPKG